MRTADPRGFDLDWLLGFAPPAFLCPHCRALLPGREGVPPRRCPACTTAFQPDPAERAAAFTSAGLTLFASPTTADTFAHAQRLAAIAAAARDSLRTFSPDYPPMRALLEAFDAARRTIHFTTYGISALLLGALKLASLRVDICGVVSGVRHDTIQRELSDFTGETPRLDVRLYGGDARYFPHQKIIVIDGLIAFKGSANMTDFGWRKAAHGREVIEVVTDTAEVTDLNNRFFSPVWADRAAGREGDTAPAALPE
jgi:phosphatidylserine/phosphatidylglycerophosphate/cardiolipin synthase-like enzyme